MKRLIIWSRQRINPSEISTEQAAQALVPYINAGITHFDTADHYADGEEILGILKKQYKDTITVGTKRCPNPWPLQNGEVRQAVERSLQRLQSNYIDLMQFHDWMPEDEYGFDRLQQLAQFQKKWLIRKIWLTNANTAYLKKIAKLGIEVSSNQVCYSLFAQRTDSQMLHYCLENNIELLAFGTVWWWFFSEKRLGEKEPSIEILVNASLKKYKRFMDVIGWREQYQAILSTIHPIAQKHNTSIATIASAYILQQPWVWWVIIGARLGQSAHIQENQKILSLQLDSDDQKKIANILQNNKPLPGDFWDEYRLDHSQLRWWHEFLTSTGSGWYTWHQIGYIQ